MAGTRKPEFSLHYTELMRLSITVCLANKIEPLPVFEHAEAFVIVVICSSFALSENAGPWLCLCVTLSTVSDSRRPPVGT